MRWEDLTSDEIGKLDKSLPVVIPLAAIEQHGVHLPTSTDCSINKLFIDSLEEKLFKEILIIPMVCITCSAHHMDFPGTLTVKHTVLLEYLKDILRSVIANGFKTLVFLNSHGGNQGLGQVLVESFGAECPDVRVLFFSWWKVAFGEKLSLLNESGFMGVGHAGEFETSLMQFLDEKKVRGDKIEDGKFNSFFDWEKGDLLHSPKVSFYKSMKHQTQNGVYGNPSFASKEKGEKIKDIVLEHIVNIFVSLRKK